jgi:hypothetical protein
MDEERIRRMPVLDEFASKVPAPAYNLWRRAWLHWPRPLRFDLAGLEPMAMILEERRWLCVDTSLFDAPVVIWQDFRDQGRDNLHEPIACTVRHYHQGAAKVRNAALEAMVEVLEARLKDH